MGMGEVRNNPCGCRTNLCGVGILIAALIYPFIAYRTKKGFPAKSANTHT